MDIQDMQITLVIKAPNQRMEDQTVDCMLDWTIRKLKHHLETVYPSKPKHHEQRLIYSGKLLQDHLTLKEVLKQYDSENTSNTHTVHLVCSNSSSSPRASSTSSTSQKAKEKSPQPAVTDSAHQSASSCRSSSPNSVPVSDVSNQQNDGLRYRGPSQPSSVPASSSFQSFPVQHIPPVSSESVAPAAYPYTPEQYAWMVQQQQAYSQYMMQYMQYYQQSLYGAGQPFYNGAMAPPMSPLNMAPPTSLPNPPQQPMVHPQQQQQQQQQLPQQPQPANNNNAQRGNNVQMNAQGGVEEEDEDDRDPRDWLHHTYFFMRFITFVGIIVFYSSFSRFVMVTAGFLIIYFLQKMRVTRQQQMRRQQQEQEQLQNEEAERQQQQQQEQQQQEQAEGTSAPSSESQPQDVSPDGNRNTEETGEEQDPETSAAEEQNPAVDQAQQIQQEEGNKVIRSLFFIWRTIESFFLSLVPVPPELMEAN